MRNRNRKGPNPLTRSYESNGGDVKIRGTALHVAEKYVQLARDAQASGDRVAGENYLQHAEHYYRIVAAAQAQMPPQQQQIYRNDEGDDDDERRRSATPRRRAVHRRTAGWWSAGGQYAPQANEPQPYVNGVPRRRRWQQRRTKRESPFDGNARTRRRPGAAASATGAGVRIATTQQRARRRAERRRCRAAAA